MLIKSAVFKGILVYTSFKNKNVTVVKINRSKLGPRNFDVLVNVSRAEFGRYSGL